MRDSGDMCDPDVDRHRTFRLCRSQAKLSSRLQRDWYHACLDCIADLEHHAAHHGDFKAAFAPWCALCAAADALNEDGVIPEDDVDYVNASPIARWIMRRLDRRFG